MKKNTKMILIGLVIFIIGFYAFSIEQGKSIKSLGIEPDNELLLFFEKTHPDNKVIMCGYEDLNDDGHKDLLVIYRESYRKNAMVVVIDMGDGFKLSDHVQAPIDNQTIEFKNIDKTGPMEFIVSGSKDGNFGYSIFRLVDNKKIIDLFGEGMEDCC